MTRIAYCVLRTAQTHYAVRTTQYGSEATMVCDICHKKHATIHLTEIVDNKVVEMHVCQSCAQEKAQALNEQMQLSGFVGGMAGSQEGKAQRKVVGECTACGFKFAEFKTKGRLGCGRCYQVFREQLLPLLKRIHGSTRHAGKVPANLQSGTSRQADIHELRGRLERAIRLEEYEEAARLRDEIRKREKKL